MSKKRRKKNKKRQKQRQERNKANKTENGGLEVIDYLKRSGIPSLKRKFGIKVFTHSKHSNVKQLNYNTLKSDFSSKIVQQCRNLIVDEADNYKIVCLGFLKFFNYGDTRSRSVAVSISPEEWKKVKVYEKLDGSIMILYFYNGEWYASSNNLPDATGLIKSINKRIGDLFWEIWKELDYKLPEDTGKVYMFEMISPDLLQIVQYDKNRMVLIGCRDMKTLKEVGIEKIAEKNGYECVQVDTRFNSYEEVKDFSKKLDPLKNEGFVVTFWDEKIDQLSQRRIKVKSPQHVYISNLKNIRSGSNIQKEKEIMMNLVLTKEDDEFLAYFPQFKESYKKVLGEFNGWCEFMSNECKKNEMQKMIDIRERWESDKNKDKSFKEFVLDEYCVKEIKEMKKTMNVYSLVYSKSLEEIYEEITSNFNKNSKKLNKIKANARMEIEKEIKRTIKKARLKVYGSSDYGMEVDSKSDLDLCLIGVDEKSVERVFKVIEKMNSMKRVKYIEYKKMIKIEYIIPKEEESEEEILVIEISSNYNNLKKCDLIKQFCTNKNGNFLVKMVTIIKYLMKRKYNISKYNKEVYINSFSLTLMIIFFLQKKQFLPVGLKFSKKLLKKIVSVESHQFGLLFLQFFQYYTKKISEEVCMKVVFSVLVGKEILLEKSKLKENKDSALYVEDPIETTENTARTINKRSVLILNKIFLEIIEEMRSGNELKKFFIEK